MMSENKRFTLQESTIYNRNDVIFDKCIGIKLPQSTACDLLNELYEKTEQLKKENNHLKYQLGDREEAFEVFASEVHDKINALIDKKIKELQYKDKVCLIPRESITVLKELKRELRL